MIKTKEFEIIDVDRLKYDISLDYESDDGEIVAVCIKGDLQYILDGVFMDRVDAEHNKVDEDE